VSGSANVKPVRALAGQRGKRAREVVGPTHLHRVQRHSSRLGHCLGPLPLRDLVGQGRIPQDRHTRGLGHGLQEQFEASAAQLRRADTEAGEVAPGPCRKASTAGASGPAKSSTPIRGTCAGRWACAARGVRRPRASVRAMSSPTAVAWASRGSAKNGVPFPIDVLPCRGGAPSEDPKHLSL
jgi:hypothetical protein